MTSSHNKAHISRHITAPPPTWRALKPRARALRVLSTTPEAILWDHLRGRALAGLKFRRQHVVLGFVVDFLCVERRLVVEVDGGYHDDPAQAAEDALRDATLIAHGYTCVRVPNQAVLTDVDGVLARILAAAAG